ncbi:dTMP kinase [Paenibacillus lautus]|uniref:dTMP kinase n=1 Tax=Paenibacillus lautus TaxID=1401 RepID=UPI003D2C11C4
MIIEFSGIDGSGKTSQMDRVFRYFNEKGINCYQRTLRSTYKRILANITTKRNLKHWSEYYTANEVEIAHALEMVNAVLTNITIIKNPNEVIVTDTYIARWLATARQWDCDNLNRINDIFSLIPKPDLSFHLDVTIDNAYERINSRAKGDHVLSFGNKSKLEKYRDSFLDIKDILPYKWHHIATDNVTPEDSFETIKKIIINHLNGSTYENIKNKIN